MSAQPIKPFTALELVVTTMGKVAHVPIEGHYLLILIDVHSK